MVLINVAKISLHQLLYNKIMKNFQYRLLRRQQLSYFEVEFDQKYFSLETKHISQTFILLKFISLHSEVLDICMKQSFQKQIKPTLITYNMGWDLF